GVCTCPSPQVSLQPSSSSSLAFLPSASGSDQKQDSARRD
ncbi:unnamed protein product, partial [Rotaria socialis]